MGYRFVTDARPAWEDQFRQPQTDQLTSHYGKQLGNLFESARERLTEYDDISEVVEWHGVPWNWTCVYHSPDDPTRAYAYLVADPEAPKIAVPLTVEMVSRLPLKRMKKHIRDAIQTGRRVADTVWATFQVANKTQLEEVMDVVKRKHRLIAEQG